MYILDVGIQVDDLLRGPVGRDKKITLATIIIDLLRKQEQIALSTLYSFEWP